MPRPSITLFIAGGASVISLSALVAAALGTSATSQGLLRLEGASRLYHHVLRKPFMKVIFGVDIDLPWTNALLDAGLLWLSLFLIINVFYLSARRSIAVGTHPQELLRTIRIQHDLCLHCR